MAVHVRLPDLEHWKAQIKCQAACPVATDAGRYAQLIAEGRAEEAFLVARAPNPFASVCGRVCAAPCEDACRRGSIDAPITIRSLKRFLTEQFGVESVRPDTQNRLAETGVPEGNVFAGHAPAAAGAATGPRRVAVVGAGPAGLAAAHDLALLGHHVTVFEAADEPGGMMRYGIPDYRLPRGVLQAEINSILRLGVTLVAGRPLTPQFALADLRAEGFEAVFLASGTSAGRDLRLPGSDLDGVVKAIDFLLNINRGYRVEIGNRVVVIGGGFVAFDAARAALRAQRAMSDLEAASQAGGSELSVVFDAARAALRGGATQVTIVSLEALDEMPVLRTAQGHEEYEEARHEGIAFVQRRGPLAFSGEKRLEQIALRRVLSVFDEQGRFAPAYDDSDVVVMPADTCILAIGQRADLSFLRPADGVELTPAGTIKIDPATLATSAGGIFAGGDVAFGPRNLIEAVANGKRAALSIHRHLEGSEALVEAHVLIDNLLTRRYRMAAGYELLDREAAPTVPLDRRTGMSEVEIGYAATEAAAQAARCLVCHVQTIYDSERCVLCNRCVDVCPEYCLAIVPLDALDADAATLDRLKQRAGANGGPAAAMVKDDERCIRCGLCAVRCPTEAMTMERFHITERFHSSGQSGGPR